MVLTLHRFTRRWERLPVVCTKMLATSLVPLVATFQNSQLVRSLIALQGDIR